MIRIGIRNFHRWVAPTLRTLKAKKERLPYRPPDPRQSYVEWNYDAELYAFGKRLGENFNKDLLKRAFTEKSFLISEGEKRLKVGLEADETLKDNEDLIGKGEELIDKYISVYLSLTLPHVPGEHIRQIKKSLMSEETLSHISKLIGADDLILSTNHPRENESLSNTLKAVIAALEESSGRETAARFVRDFVVSQLCGMDLTPMCTPEKPFEMLDSIVQKNGGAPIEARLLSQAAVNTLLPVYYVGIYSNKKMCGKGFGESIEIAKEMAACDALWNIWGVNIRKKPFPLDLEIPASKLDSQISHDV